MVLPHSCRLPQAAEGLNPPGGKLVIGQNDANTPLLG